MPLRFLDCFFHTLNDLDMTAEELLAKYAAGEREFPKAELSGADLSGVDLRETDLSGANLDGARR